MIVMNLNNCIMNLDYLFASILNEIYIYILKKI